MSIVLIGGGSRSGKSRYALSLAREWGLRRGFLATAQPFDDEMRQRIALHQQERGTDFLTIEEPLDLAQVILQHQEALDVLVIDCLTLWLSNALLCGQEPCFEPLIATAATTSARMTATHWNRFSGSSISTYFSAT